MKTRYVLGFAFDHKRQNVVLIKKNGNSVPEHTNLLNGVGGKIELREYAEEAMSREFMEETGVLVPEDRWTRAGRFYGDTYSVEVFTVFDDAALSARTCEAEPVFKIPVYDLHRYACCPHVPLLVRLCLDSTISEFSFRG